MSESCRTCGEFIKKSSAKHLFESNESICIHQIEVLTGLWLENSEDMPVFICAHCQRDLRHAVEFRERVITTQAQFQQKRNQINSFSEEQIPLKQETDSEGEEINVYKVIYESDIERESVEIEDYIDETININVGNHDEEQQSHAEYSGKDQVGEFDSERLQIIVQNESSKKVKKQAKKREWRKDCVCDQCGKHFKNLSNFKLHMLRHDGIKNYECNVCGDKFYTRHFLRQHKRRHTDERPFACHYCDSRFRSWSNRVDHERSHTNERPFQCRHCDKRFYTCSIRNDHELVHTGVRKFHCEVCDQWFLRRTHLVTHNRSKSHKLREQQEALTKNVNDKIS